MDPASRSSARSRVILVLTATSFVAASTGASAVSLPAWHGIWRGTIGKVPVQACLQHKDYGDSGAYYYLSHRSIISLGKLAVPPGNIPAWTEAPNSDTAAAGPLWHVRSITADRLQGTWTGSGRTLPINLASVKMTKSADESADLPCGNLAFSLPRFSKPVVTTRAAVLKGVGYTRIDVDIGKQFGDSSFQSFQLRGNTPAITRVNAQLYKDIPTSRATAMYFECSRAALAQSGMDGDASSIIKPEIITRDWMVSRTDTSSDCGGAHPNTGSTFQTWDLRTGTAVDLDDWFTAAALTQTVKDPGTKNSYISVSFTPVFRRMIDAAYGRDEPDCAEAEKSADFWDSHLTTAGIAFTPELSHADTPCIKDAVIPFAKLMPYFNSAGKVGYASFMSALRDKH